MMYVVEQFGDIAGKDEFPTLRESLEFVERICTNLALENYDWDEDAWIKDGGFPSCDPEDNRITIKKDGKVIWHFSGWHWDGDEFGIPQGKLLGHTKSLYEESND